MIARSWSALREIIFRKLRLLQKVRARFSGRPERKGSPSRIYWLYQDASELSGKTREKFLDALRRDDESAYLEILSLLKNDDSPIIPRKVPQPLLKSGDTLGRYTIIEFIEEGGMGEVYKASHPELGVRVLKILSRELAENTAFIERLRLEAKAANALNHRNVVTIHDFDREGHLQFMVMEFVEGQSLRKMIGNLTVEVAVDYATQMAQALGFAHSKGIIHRDIKPENVMVRPDGVIKILDFGLAKPVSLGIEAGGAETMRIGPTEMKTDPHILLGTLRYMAPEQLDYKGASSQSDIWSWGVVCYEMLAGRGPFEASSDHEVMEAIKKRVPGPPCRYRDLNRIIMKALRKKPDERYGLMTEAAEDLKNFIPPSWTRRAAVMLGLALLLIVGYPMLMSSMNPNLHLAKPSAPLTTKGGHVASPGISAKMRMVYTSEDSGESTLRLVEIVDGVPLNDRAIIKSIDAKIIGAVFAQSDDRTVYFLLQNSIDGTGILYRLRLSPRAADSDPINTNGGSENAPESSVGLTLNFSRASGPCQDHSPDVTSVTWYHRMPGIGYFEPLCQNQPPEKIADDASVDSQPGLSPDGKYFAFFWVKPDTNAETLFIGNAEGGRETPLMTNNVPPYDYLRPLWSPDGNTILTATWDSSRTTLWQISVKNGKSVGKPKSTYLDKMLLRGRPAWLNNGLSIAASARTNGASKAQILQVSLNSGRYEEMFPLNDDFGDLDSITCPQGLFRHNCPQMLVAAKVGDLSEVWTESLQEGWVRRIASQEKFSDLTWAGNENLVSESGYFERSVLVLLDASGRTRAVTPITRDNESETYPAASPDGHYLVYVSVQDGSHHLWRMDLKSKNAAPRQLTFGSSMEYQPSISPNSEWVIFTSIETGRQTLRMVRLSGGTPQPIAPHNARNASISPNGDILCEYLDRSRAATSWKWVIAILDGDGNLKRSFPDIPTRTPVRWSKDGKSILYVKEQNGIDNVWKKRLDGGVDTQFTHFGEERIFAFALSPDGNKVACLCGPEKTSQIVQMQLAK